MGFIFTGILIIIFLLALIGLGWDTFFAGDIRNRYRHGEGESFLFFLVVFAFAGTRVGSFFK